MPGIHKSDIGQPRLVYPQDLRHLSHAQFFPPSSAGSRFSIDDQDSITSAKTYASYRLKEKQKEDVHASGGTWIELFYDLFFAASLSAFSRTREVSSKKDLVDLAAFFTILWWTWTSQTLFDVRYSRHAKSEKVVKFLQLLLMIGYGVFSKDFSVFNRLSSSSMQATSDTRMMSMMAPRHRARPKVSSIAITVLFMTSRMILGIQYFRVAIRKHHGETFKTQIQNTALISTALPYLAAVFWLASLFISGTITAHGDMFVSRTALWIVGILVEMIGTFVMRLHKGAGFEKSHLSERYGSLTIIILGEGIIKLVSRLRDISAGVGFHVKSVVAIVAAVFSFYLIFVLYFDDFSLHEKIHSVRAYSWAYMHFFLHLALVLCLDGITSLLLFTNIFGAIEALISAQTQGDVLAHLMNCQNFNMTSTTPLALGNVSFDYNVQSTKMTINGTELSQSQYDYVFINLFLRIFQSYNVEPSEEFFESIVDMNASELDASLVSTILKTLFNQFVISAQFFLLAVGTMFLTMIPIMYWQNRLWVANWSRWLPLSARLVAGLAMLGVGLATDFGKKVMSVLLVSGTLIPIFMATASLVYAVDKLVVIYLQFI